MPNYIRNLHTVDRDNFPYIFEQNVTVPLQSVPGLIRCNVYRPKSSQSAPVLVTYGPYGKDIHYKDFHPTSYSELNERHKSAHSAWETPDPAFWTSQGYVLVRADELGLGQSPGKLDTMSRDTSDAFFDVIEWASEQSWSTGKVGLLGISYYAGSQWRVAARQPKGLAAIVPWEGMSDYYRDRCRHGGILSNGFIKFWWDRQVITNQYGRPGRSARNWGPDTIEGDLDQDELVRNRQDQTIDNQSNRFRDDMYYASREYDMTSIEVPLLSVGNWGGILLHLRGNVEGYLQASSRHKFLRFITGRHDLPFYYDEEVRVQLSFLNAFLKGDDPDGWAQGAVSPVSLVLRQGNVGYNDAKAERSLVRRDEKEWPIARTDYRNLYLSLDHTLQWDTPQQRGKLSYPALSTIDDAHTVCFTSAPFATRTEITGHILAHLHVSVTPEPASPTPTDIDLFVTIRHIDHKGDEVFYTGTAGDPVPVTKGWLRVSMRQVDFAHPRHREWRPWRSYTSRDVLPVIQGEIYGVDIEIWPTNVVLTQGSRLVFEVSSGDTQGSGIFLHNDSIDRSPDVFRGMNNIHFGPTALNYITLPVIPDLAVGSEGHC